MKKSMSLLILTLFLMFTTAALAGEWNFYGSARMATFWTDKDLADTTELETALQSNARIGAKVKATDSISGQFEYGASDGNANIRYLYGQWEFGDGSLLVGQYETPLYMPISNQVYNADNGLGGWGEVSPGRKAQVGLNWGGFKIAIVEPDDSYLDDSTSTVVTGGATEQVIPRVEASFTAHIDDLTLAVGGGYNSFEYNKNEDIDSYVGLVCAQYRHMGFFLGGQAFAGQNVGNIIDMDTSGTDPGKGYAKIQSGRVIDNDAFGFEVVAGYLINDMFAVEAGYGYTQTEYENATEDEVCAYYVQTPITLAPGVLVVPEVGIIDYDEQGQDEISYLGAKWQINF